MEPLIVLLTKSQENQLEIVKKMETITNHYQNLTRLHKRLFQVTTKIKRHLQSSKQDRQLLKALFAEREDITTKINRYKI